MSDIDLSSPNNSTDDPDYKTETERESESSESDDDFVKPPRAKGCLKKSKKSSPEMADQTTDKAASPSSPAGGYFNLTQIVEEHSQEAVIFKNPFDDLRPGRYLFVTKDGKITRTKDFALSDERGFVLIFTTLNDLTQFCAEAVDPSVSHDRVFLEHSSVPRKAGDSADRFNILAWVNSDSMQAEIDLDTWYKLMEDYSGVPGRDAGLNLRKNLEDKVSAPTRDSQPPPPQSSKFNFKLIEEDTSDFIERNMSESTRKVTRVSVSLFDNFMKQVHPELLHSTLATVEEFRLPSLISEFFKVLQKGENESYNASTLQAYYLGLARFLNQKRSIVLKNNPKYDQCRTVLSRQQKISCEKGQRPGINASHAYPPEVLAEGWSKGAFGSSTPKGLIAALLIHLGPAFGIRGKQELGSMLNEDLILGPRREDGVLSNIRYSERKTKTRKGLNGQGARPIDPVVYPDDGRPERCPVRLYDLYQSKKPAEMLGPKSRFWLGCKNGLSRSWSEVDVWYVSQPMGVNTLAPFVAKQIESKGIDNQGLKLTGVSTRKTGIDGALVCGMPTSYVACLAGQKTLAAQTHYMSPTDATLKATSRMMSNVINGEAAGSSTFSEILAEEKSSEAERIANIRTSAADSEMTGLSAAITEMTGTSAAVTEITGTSAAVTEMPGSSTADSEMLETSAKAPPPSVMNESKQKKSKKSKKKRKHRRRSPSSSSSSSSSTASDSSSSSEDDKKSMKRKMKKLKRKMKRERRRNKENRPPVPMYLPMMMPIQGLPYLNNNISSVPHFQEGVSGQVLSQITQHTVAKATNAPQSHGNLRSHGNNLFLRDEIE